MRAQFSQLTRIYLWFGVGLFLSFLLVGCAVGPDYKPPVAPNVSGYDPAPISHTDSARTDTGARQNFIPGKDIPGDWWTLFHSRPLNHLVEIALKNNPDLEVAQQALRAARENVYAEEGSFFPTITGVPSATREKNSSALSQSQIGFPVNSSAYNLYNASLSLTYNLDVFGGTRRQVESLIAEDEYERYELEASYLSLTANLVTAAVTEASLRDQIEATQEIINDETKQLKIVQTQFDLGGASKADVLVQDATLRQTQATLPPLQLQLAQEINQIKAYAGQLPSEDMLAVFHLNDLHLPTELPVSLPSQLTAQRPDIQASAALLHQASANIGVAVANRLPQITLSADLGSEALMASSLFTPGVGLWSIAAGISQPIFEGGALLHKQKAAEAAFDQAAAKYRSTVVIAFQNVANTLKALKYDANTLQATLAEQTSAQASLTISEGQYKSGATTFLTLLTSQQTYQNARINFVKARASRLTDTAALYQALGGGWWHRSDPKKQPGFIENPL